MGTKRSASLVILILFICISLGVLGAFLGWKIYLGPAPEILAVKPPRYLGEKTPFGLLIKDSGKGVSKLEVALQQGSTEKIILANTDLAAEDPEGIKITIPINAIKMGLAQGPATLEVRAWGKRFGTFFPGKFSSRRFTAKVDTTPPKIFIRNSIIHMRRGGAALAIYETSEDAKTHGVVVGTRTFPGYRPYKDNPRIGISPFAYSQDEVKGAKIEAFAVDQAGNQIKVPVNVRVRWRKYRQAKLKLSDRTIKILSSRFAAISPEPNGTPVEIFTWINTEFRKDINQKIKNLAQKTEDEMLWQGPFDRPRGQPMAGFGDRRTYYHKGESITRAVHLGVDLADVAQSPILAAASGIVRHAGPMGIYGGCVILDHGQGVASLYGHLSSTGVKVGDLVEKGQRLGLSGATGLALGDHLHYSVLVNGVYVNPVEWWDSHWIKDNIMARYVEAGLPFPGTDEKEKKADS
jgi:murein DD-endopeptidase MepM/ murein hydrolase activator NlpD